MGRNPIETLMGAVVIAVAVFFFVFAYSTADIKTVEGYSISARFDRIDGIREGSDVRMSGVRIGTVTGQALDPQTYLAVVTMSIDPAIRLPLDTSASINAEGLLGEKYLALSPGGDEEMIPRGGEIEITQGSVDLMSLIGQVVLGQAGGEANGISADDEAR